MLIIFSVISGYSNPRVSCSFVGHIPPLGNKSAINLLFGVLLKSYDLVIIYDSF